MNAVEETVLPELEMYNVINRRICSIPSYNALKSEKRYELYFNRDGDVIITAWAGAKYWFWMSKTKTADEERNARIFHHIVFEDLCYVQNPERVLEAAGMNCADLETYHRVELNPIPEVSRRMGTLCSLSTPFNHSYDKTRPEESSRLFAEDVRNHVRIQEERCKLRECGGVYEEILKIYAEELSRANSFGSREQQLKELLDKEDYLILSPEETIRNTYLDCCRRCRQLMGL